jgi:hypothetical protein
MKPPSQPPTPGTAPIDRRAVEKASIRLAAPRNPGCMIRAFVLPPVGRMA